MKYGAWLFLIASLSACHRKPPPNRFSDVHFQRIAEWQDHRYADSLSIYLGHFDSRYREAAALALASVQDSSQSSVLGSLMLEDSVPAVRSAAAFALGQTGGTQAVNALLPALSDSRSVVRREVLEALGKTVHQHDRSTLLTFQLQDSLDEEGLGWALYRLGVRGLADSACIQRAVELYSRSNHSPARLGVVHFFARGSFALTDPAQPILLQAVFSPDPSIRMAAAHALRKFVNSESQNALTKVLKDDPDYRVRTNAIRSLRFFEWSAVKATFEQALSDSQINVRIAAAEALRLFKDHDAISSSLAWARLATNGRVKALLYEAAAAEQPAALTHELEETYLASASDYDKAWLAPALALSSTTAAFLRDQLKTAAAPVLKTNLSAAIAHWDRQQKARPNREVLTEIANYYLEQMHTGDPGIIISFSDLLKDETLGYPAVVDRTRLHAVRSKLQLPRDFEALVALEEAIASMEGSAYQAPAKTFNHSINWDSVKLIPRDQRIQIVTSQGNVELKMLVEEAPGSVWNFLSLAKQHYFDQNYFHRVVPNFVVQVGCRRGDGLGSEAYSIRSEFGRRRYKTGSVGMASAGKDTEGTQWFITHSPTPHLDGGYTIFAEVTQGMDIVDRLQVGDQIKAVIVLPN